MSELTADHVTELWECCRAGAAVAAEAFGRAWGGRYELVVGEPGDWEGLPGGDGDRGGLVIVLGVGGRGVLLVLPEGAPLVPDWTASPDATGTSRLETLGQELGAALLPEVFFPDRVAVGRVEDLAGAVGRGGLAETARAIPLELRDAGGQRAAAYLVWPLERPDEVLSGGTGYDRSGGTPAGPAGRGSDAAGAFGPEAGRPAKSVSVEDLPDYARSLLRIRVPVVVTLARKRQPLGRVVELGPGSIIQFDKSCEELLDLEVRGHRVAVGEAVKVGDKFGLRLKSIILPGERFVPVRPGGAPGSGRAGESLH